MHTVIDTSAVQTASAFERLTSELHDMAGRIAAGDERAPVDLHRLISRLQGHADPRCTGLLVFASALAQRVSGAMAQTANLYLRRFEVPQIELFNLLGRCMPMVTLATQVANAVIAEALRGQAHATVIDIGIGTGRQIVALLEQLQAAGKLPAELTVIGVEPGLDALAAARSALAETTSRMGVALHFHGFASCAEALTDADWAAMQAQCATRPVINASFALHHIADNAQGHDQRSRVLRQLHALQPLALVLTEPDVDHLEPRFLPRFGHCLRHFGAVFDLLDALPITQAERDALKVGFFGREIADVLGTAEPLRSERHESTSAWQRRLAETGFVAPRLATSLPGGLTVGLLASGHRFVSVQARSTHVVLASGGEPMVAILVATPAASPARPNRHKHPPV